MSCDGISVVKMGCSIDPLDVCFGGQLAGSVTLGIYAQELAHVVVLTIRLKLWGTLSSSLCWIEHDESEIV